jgi:hypothetical protein
MAESLRALAGCLATKEDLIGRREELLESLTGVPHFCDNKRPDSAESFELPMPPNTTLSDADGGTKSLVVGAVACDPYFALSFDMDSDAVFEKCKWEVPDGGQQHLRSLAKYIADSSAADVTGHAYVDERGVVSCKAELQLALKNAAAPTKAFKDLNWGLSFLRAKVLTATLKDALHNDKVKVSIEPAVQKPGGCIGATDTVTCKRRRRLDVKVSGGGALLDRKCR